jgi:hypothetical protein
METQDSKKVIEIEGVKLSAEAIKEIFRLQHYFIEAETNFKNELADIHVGFINESIHVLIDLSKQDEKRNEDIMGILWVLNDCKNLINALKAPE